jgi:tetratricopeptide (TPR) repeat protein
MPVEQCLSFCPSRTWDLPKTTTSPTASPVFDQLNVTLLEPERRAMDARPTADMEAYQAYLRGLDYAARPGFSLEDFRLAISMFGRAVEPDPDFALAPDEVWGYAFNAVSYWLGSGDLEAARAVLQRMTDNDEPTAQYIWFSQEVLEGDYQAALDRLASLSVEIIEVPDASIPTAFLAGLVYQATGNTARARTSFESAVVVLERQVAVRSGDGRVHSALGLTYATLGRRDDAIREANLAVEMIPVSEDALRGPKQIDLLAQTYRALGEYDAAFDQLEYELSIPAMMSVEWLRIDPGWAPLRDHPRFRALVGASDGP